MRRITPGPALRAHRSIPSRTPDVRRLRGTESSQYPIQAGNNMSENETMARAESTEGSSVATERQSTTKVIRAAIVGTVVEYYDFGIYGYMATTIAALFFV